ncbi:PKD domain-containing protein [bacterium]|nr:PKD domain-containing protein [bacterium]
MADGEKPAAGSGAANWRLARIDGDYNGVINAADITPIAQHWGEQLHGYYICRAVPGSSDFLPLTDPDQPEELLFVPRAAADHIDPHRVVQYTYTDLLADSGKYTYYVVPVCLADAEQLTGPGSRTAQALRNLAPLAMIMATPTVPGGPLYTFDASESFDTDGSIVGYEWSLDHDAVFEVDAGNNPVLEYRFNEAGNQRVLLRVTDDAGGTGTDIVMVTVDFINVAYFTCTPQTGRAPVNATFDPSGSYFPTGVEFYR